MTDRDKTELGKKRSMLTQDRDGPGPALQDIPLSDRDAPTVPAGSPVPITIETMARYLRELTETPQNSRANAYPIKDTYSLVSSHESSGETTALVTPSDAVANVFASDSDRDVVLAAAGAMFDDDTIRKLRDPRTGYHEVLRTIVSNDPGRNPESSTPASAPEIQRKISGVLQKNRFNPEPGRTPFLPLSTAASTVDSRPIGRGQSQLGAYDTSPSDGVTYEKMKRVGLALMLRATGELVGHDGDPTDAGISTAALLPGSAQLLGSKIIDRKSMWAGDLSTDQGRPAAIGLRDKSLSLDLTLDNGSNSYGVLNNHLEPFGGFAPVGMIALGAALILAVKLLSEGFELLLKIPSPPTTAGSDNAAPSPDGAIRTPGTSRFEPLSTSESIVSLFGFTPTRHDYSQAFDRGVDVFFGFDGLSDIATGAKRLSEAPGYYVVMIREIIRSGAKIIESIVDAFKSGPLGAIQGLLGLVDVIRSSKITAYFNMVANLGDILMTLEDEGIIGEDSVGDLAEPGNLPNNGKISTIDRLVTNPASRISKNRIAENTTTLAWRTSATPSIYLLPGAVLNAADYMPLETNVGLTTLSDTPIDVIKGLSNEIVSTRLSPETVRMIEDELDSEYVPFYFHDLRTNEIVSFHAFLNSCNDSFNATYESGGYYGRVEPVRIYSHTERTINLGFTIAATNPDDFDVMWWKINKLVTMLYPQWSKGRKLVVEKGVTEFIQPFSQVPSSSPVIRLRLGDVISSNYSKFSLARLFGLGTNDFKTEGSADIDPTRAKKLIDLNIAVNEEKKRILQKPLDTKDAETYGYKKGYRAWMMPTRNLRNQIFAAPNTIAAEAAIPETTKMYEVEIKDVKEVTLNNKLTEVGYVVEFSKKDFPLFSTGPYHVSHNQLQPHDDDIKRQVINREKDPAADPGDVSDSDIEKIKFFFDGKNNAIVRSFESSMGKGLAGVITSMAFDWKAPTWDTTDIGRRAPQWCQVTMTFMPIHDIAPGIDANGFNRAPVYNVGSVIRGVTSDPSTSNEKELFSTYHSEISKARQKK